MKYTWKQVIESYTPEKRKKTSIWARIFSRPISFLLTYLLINIGVTANIVSVLSIFEAVLACVFFMMGGNYLPVGIALFLFWDVLDCTDGNIARVKQTSSVVGEYLDAISGYTAPAFIYLSVGVAAFKSTTMFHPNEYLFIVAGGIASISDILSRIIYQKYVVTEYSLGINKDMGIEKERKNGLYHIADVIMRNLTYSCLFMPLLVVFYIINHLDYLIIFYALYSLAILMVTYIVFIKNAINLETKLRKNNRL